jgi:hypothetical protein
MALELVAATPEEGDSEFYRHKTGCFVRYCAAASFATSAQIQFGNTPHRAVTPIACAHHGRA